MFLKIESFAGSRLIGHCIRTCFTQDRTFELWRGFMPVRNQIIGVTDTDFVSLQRYPATFDFATIDPDVPFEKWAGLRVTDDAPLPDGFLEMQIPAGDYAVFLHTGPSSDAAITFSYIFQTWLPASSYRIDHRPHFEILGASYKHGQPDSREEIYIPIALKT